MDRRTTVALLVFLALYSAWFFVRRASAPPPPDPAAVAEAPANPADPASPPAPAAPVASAIPEADLPPIRALPFAACGANGTVSTEGGALRDVVLSGMEEPYRVTPWWSWLVEKATGAGEPGGWQPYGGDPGPARLLGPAAGGLVPGSGALANAAPRMAVVSESPDAIALQGVTAEGVTVAQKFTSSGEPCVLDVEVTWANHGDAAYDGKLWLGLYDQIEIPPSGFFAPKRNLAHLAAWVDGGLEQPNPAKLDPALSPEGDVSWFAVTDRYFGMFVMPADSAAGALWFTDRGPAPGAPPEAPHLKGAQWVHATNLGPNQSFTQHFRVYMGRLEPGALDAVDPTLRKVLNYGWFAAFATPLLWLLKVLEGAVGNWGVAIILLTIALKVGFYPLTSSAMKSGQAMQALQPKLTALREQYKDNQEEMNRRTMELFREAGVNPLGGCLPMVIQMPVWFAMFRVLQASVELYHSQFLYLHDLTAPDPYGVLPLLTMGFMWLQQQMTPMGNVDPAQQRVLKLMPIFFGLLFFSFPSGLALYSFSNTVLTMLQQFWIKRQFPPLKPAQATA